MARRQSGQHVLEVHGDDRDHMMRMRNFEVEDPLGRTCLALAELRADFRHQHQRGQKSPLDSFDRHRRRDFTSSPSTAKMDLLRQGLAISSNPKHTTWLCPLLLLADAALCGIVVWKIPYTEIDWTAYMQQVNQYIKGERDYMELYGDTGPLVYPAAHVYIYRLLHYLTDEGRDIRLAQYIFVALYLATLSLVVQCYRQAKTPPWVFALLILSKRLHSIFMLRLFNDCFAVFFLFLAVFCYQRRLWTLGSLAYTVGLGVKMSLLLALPAVGMVLWQGMGRDRALRQAAVMAQVQVLLGYPFLAAAPRSYFARAFEFTRQFLFRWTVNWRFVGENTFMSRPFSHGLLLVHGVLLGLFIATKWLKPMDVDLPTALKHLIQPPTNQAPAKTSRRVTPDFILSTILTAMIVGCLCARSLHYQFYAYIAWSTPFLLWRSGLHPVVVYVVWAAQEWAWNVYPSTSASSIVVISTLSIATLSAWVGEYSAPIAMKDKRDHEE